MNKKMIQMMAKAAKNRRVKRRSLPDYQYWRKNVLLRDKYRCQICHSGNKGNLVAHHLESYLSNPDLRTSIPNGITLCNDCHNDFHKRYGMGNNTKQQFDEYAFKRKHREF